MTRRTINVSDPIWRAVRMRAVADGKSPSDVIEAIAQSAVIAGGPILYGDDPLTWRLRNIHEWLASTDYGNADAVRFAQELADGDRAEGRDPILPVEWGTK